MALFKRKKSQQQANDRTIRSGAPQQKVISYYTASRRQLDNFERTSPQSETSLAYRRSERLRASWFTILIIIVSVVVLGYLGSLSTKPHVTVTGTQYRTAADYQKQVEQAFRTSDVRNRFKPLLQSKALEQAIKEAVPEAQTVTVRSNLLGHLPEVKISTSKPLAVFTQSGSTDYILSDRGRLLLPAASSLIPSTELPLVQNLTGVQGTAGEQFMRPDETNALSRLLGQFAVENSRPLFTLNTVPHEIIAQEPGRGSYSVKFLLDETIVEQFGSLRATEKKLLELQQTPAEYIDARLVDKVYYK